MTEEILKSLSLDKLFDLLIQTTKELTLVKKENKAIITIIEGNEQLLRRVIVSKRIENLWT